MMQIIQVDRDAAADALYNPMSNDIRLAELITSIERGERDDHWLVQFHARAREAERANKWQDIATAPKDEAEILLWQPKRAIYIGYWSEDQWWTDAEWANDHKRFYPPICNPTKWQPLPEPPGEHTQESQP